MATPKTGTRSIYNILGNLGGKKLIEHQYIIPAGYEDYWKFTIVRNPYSRAVSQYRSIMHIPKYYNQYGLRKPIDIQGFFELLLSFKMYRHPIHTRHVTRCQYYYSDNADHIIRYENLEEELKKLDFIPNDLKIPRMNSSISKDGNKKHWSSWLNTPAIRAINQIYARDFMIGYEMVDEWNPN